MTVLDGEQNPWRRMARRVAYENQWLTVFEDEVIRPDGQPGIYGVVHFRNRAVGVVVMDDDERTLLVGQYRYVLDRYSWEIPEGGCAPEETPLDAAKRELLEEAGYSAERWELVLEAELSNSVTDEVAFIFLATDLLAGTPAPDGTEVLATRWVPFSTALRMVDEGAIRDALSILALQRVASVRSAGAPAAVQDAGAGSLTGDG
jgi:8-oxo-dGTP pyrophosphatase MutT (NUDIX family)